VSIVIVIGLLLSGGFLARELIHIAVDSQIALSMTSSITSITDLSTNGLQSSVSAGQVNDWITTNRSATSVVDLLSVAFHPNYVLIKYSVFGTTGTVQTGITAQSGKLMLTHTTLDGILGWVETGQEFASTADQALARLNTPNGVESDVISEGSLTLLLAALPSSSQ